MVIAGPELVVGFRFAGIPGTAVETRDQALAAWDGYRKTGVRVVLVSGEVYDLVADELGAWQSTGKFPLVGVVPRYRGSERPAKSLVSLVREAVGIPV